MPTSARRAVVLGASMSGLLAVRAIRDRFDEIVVVERDVLPSGAELRKGVPQAGHAHGVLASGYRILSGYFPGLMDELTTLGAPRGDITGDFLWYLHGCWKLRHPSGLRGITVSRPCLESAVRRRVRAFGNVTFREDTEAVAPSFDPGTGAVTGVSVRPRGSSGGETETLSAQLVIDATGRASRSARWLEEWGFGRPRETLVKVDVGYATRIFVRRPGDLYGSNGAIVSGTPPESTRYGAVLAAEGDRWIVTLVGNLGDHPPTDEADWLAFAESLPSPAVHELVRAAQPLSDIYTYGFPANRWRHYERMKRFPKRYLVIGDAYCCFNPIYGQGMSVAAAEAKVLEECVAADLDGVATRFYARARKVVDIPWRIATGEDYRFPQVEGRRPPGFKWSNRYLDRLHAVAARDEVVCDRFFDVLNLLAGPTSLLSPSVAWRVLAGR